ncbi:MAG: hypothetical protein J0H14_26630 [Alphaproteobacteria bacterium]|jgi:hypothetical protein|nr:hypothetical protein [Alphaproteobacteria bacterium]
MSLARKLIYDVLASKDVSAIEEVFVRLVCGEAVIACDGARVAEEARSALLKNAAEILATDIRPVPRQAAAVLHDLAPDVLSAEPTFAVAAAIARANLSKLGTGDRRFMDERTIVADIIAEEGVWSPRLREVGRDHGGAGRGDAPDGSPDRGIHVPGGGEGEQLFSGDGSFDDPDAPDVLPRR